MSSKPGTKTPPAKAGGPKSKNARLAATLNTTATPQVQAAQETRKQALSEKQRQAAVIANRRVRMIRLRNIAIATVVIVALGAVLVWQLTTQAQTDELRNTAGELVAQQSSPHIPTMDTPHDPYTTDPPTSGPHVQEVPAWGIHSTEIRKETQVHALEDAGIVINYQPDLDKATVDRLVALTKSYSDKVVEEKGNVDNHVLMSPYPGLSNKIVLTAWQRILRLDSFDEAKIKKFINAYKNIDHHVDSGS